MKTYNRLLIALATGAAFASCADTTVNEYFPVEKPESIKESEYLLDYGNIKDMVDRAKYPNFKIACALEANDYNNRGVYYRVANANFDEITLGNAMKYASVVGDDGSMDFSTIEELLQNAEAAGMSVYGHTLGWHAQQNTTHLNNCLADKAIPSYEVEDYVVNYGELDEYPFSVSNVTPVIADGVAVFDVTKRKAKFYLIENMATVPGQSYTVRVTVRSSKENNLPVRFYESDKTATTMPVTLDWNTVKLTFTAESDNSYVMIDMGNLTQKIEVENLVVSHMTPSTAPLTEAEKSDTIRKEMVRWVDAMMEVCAGKVKAWDMINEAVSGDGNVEGQYYDLWTASTLGSDAFCWSDYLGKDQYGPVVSKAARESWAKYGGDPAELKLFVNDYNLESDWDNNKKLKSMIYWVNLWNKNGATIDGIGTQMHVGYYENKATMASKAKHMVNMLHLMAESGYLVRISELDMGYVDLSGNDVKTVDLTKEQHQNMANYYQFIIQMYLKIIPQAQQYSVCQWCLTDSPKDSGWRAETPVGLWTLDWNRKTAYAAYCDALTKDIPATEDFFEYLQQMGLTHYVTPATAE